MDALMRQCGSCTACCTVMGVEELSKPSFKSCTHVVTQGCGIYSDRPQSCRNFVCVWLLDSGKIFRNMERPDHLGVMFDVTLDKGVLHEMGTQALVAREVRPGAFKEPAAQKLLERLGKRVLIVTVEDHARGLIGPENLVKLAKRGALRVLEGG